MNKARLSISIAAGLLIPSFYSPSSIAEPETVKQLSIEYAEKSPAMPAPLKIRDWSEISRRYYSYIFDLNLKGRNLPVSGLIGKNEFFSMASYMNGEQDRSPEALNGIAAIVGAGLAGQDMKNYNGVNYVEYCRKWLDPKLGIFRNRPTDRGGVIHSDIYGYWPVMLSLMLADVYAIPDAKDTWIKSTMERFNQLCIGMGCPDNADFFNLGFDFSSNKLAGREEPMNRLGNASAVAWIMYVGWNVFNDEKYLKNSEAAIRWHLDHPGRYEITHLPGPLVVARMNAELGRSYDLSKMMKIWFGDFEKNCPWKVICGVSQGGYTCDGLDGAWWGGKDNDFYAFSMGTLQGPAWLVPVARYDTRYAHMIGKYVLHAANSSGLLQGYGLDWDHQDNKDWKDKNDPQFLLFYEGLASRSWWDSSIRPYATGDPVRLGWFTKKPIDLKNYLTEKRTFSHDSGNISLYMGNHVGFLGGIMRKTDVEGILVWDCLKTDYYHQKAFPTYLVFNPYNEEKTFTFEFTNEKSDYYDSVSGNFILKEASGKVSIKIIGDCAMVLSVIPAGTEIVEKEGNIVAGGIVIKYKVAADRKQ